MQKLCRHYFNYLYRRPYGNILISGIEDQIQSLKKQGGFCAGRSCIDKTFTLQQLIEKRIARSRTVHLIFVDLDKANDTVLFKKPEHAM